MIMKQNWWLETPCRLRGNKFFLFKLECAATCQRCRTQEARKWQTKPETLTLAYMCSNEKGTLFDHSTFCLYVIAQLQLSISSLHNVKMTCMNLIDRFQLPFLGLIFFRSQSLEHWLSWQNIDLPNVAIVAPPCKLILITFARR